MSPELRANGELELASVSGTDVPATVESLLAIQDALRRAPCAPLLIHGTGGGFVLSGAVRKPEARVLLIRTCDLLASHQQPVLAATGGALTDAGLELALACDLRFVEPGTTIGLPSASQGWLPIGAGQRITRLAGSSIAARVLLLAETLSFGDEPPLSRLATVCDDPISTGRSALATLHRSAPLALEALKVALRTAEDTGLSAGVEIEADLACLLLPTEDRAEGLAASGSGREPRFRGK